MLFLLLLILALLRPLPLSADTYDDLNAKIAEYTKKLDELARSKDTLSNQISILNSQISLTTLKIAQTETQIKKIQLEISELSLKISSLDTELNHLSRLYIEQVSENYKLNKRLGPWEFLYSPNFNNYLEQMKYISVLQKNSQDLLLNLETARTNYAYQKNQKNQKQIELTTLENKLSDQQTSLSRQKLSKSDLLNVTKNDEKKYQQLKKAAEDELTTLLKARFVGKRDVKKGDILGTMGNTGYSFGDHLHFGLYNLKENELNNWNYTSDIDPGDYLRQHRLPMDNPTITQGRGQTPYSYLYADRFHHGIDYVSTQKSIKAINDGVAYFYRNAQSSLGNHVKLFHSDGKMSLYLHLQ